MSVKCTTCVYAPVMVKAGLDARARQRYRCPRCGSRKTPEWRPAPVLKVKQFEAASELFAQGYSLRFVATAVGIVKETATRYKRLAIGERLIYCQCGRKAGHQGWCAWRVSLSPTRQSYYERCAAQSAIRLAQVRPRVEPVLTTWPYIRLENDDYSLLQKVNELVPRSIPEHARADACQEILLDVISGALAVEQIPNRIKEYLKRAYAFLPSKFGPISLDAPMYASDERPLADVLVG